VDSLSLFHENYVISFILLFVRISALLAFLPIFNNMSIPMKIKATFALYLTLIFYFSVPPPEIPESWLAIFTAILSEITFAMFVGLFLNITLYILMYAGEHISLIMGFSMASVFDYQTNISMPMISQFLGYLALMTIFAFDGHHLMLQFIHDSLKAMPLGGFIMSDDIFDYTVNAFKNLFVIGLSIAFPILALSL
jgi:flagellar biosynthetic protein FliR